MRTLTRPRPIQGRGGKDSGGGRAAKEDPDSLQSRQKAKILELLSEGEIEGIVGGLSGVFFNGTRIMDESGYTLTDVATTSGSDQITSASAEFEPTKDVGRIVAGAGIPEGSSIQSVIDENTVKLTGAATATATGVTVAVSGANNFTNYKVYLRTGTQDQDYIPGFDKQENIVTDGAQLKTTNPWIHTVLVGAADMVRVTVRFPRLQKLDTKTGDIKGTSVQLRVSLKPFGGSYQTVIDDTVRGKSSGPYPRAYLVNLTGTGPWDVKVERITADNEGPEASQALSNDTFIESYSEIIDSKLRYPNSAIIGIEIDAEQFGSIPERAYHARGRRIQVPANYDPITRDYDETPGNPGVNGMGVWDGTFKTAWSDSPPWCWYDLLTHTRYGLGESIDPASIDKYALYTIGQYCDARNTRPGNPQNNYGATGKHGVSDGRGGWEPRFTCNLYLQERQKAMQVIQDMASVFRAIALWADGLILPIQNKPYATLAHHFSPDNVVGGRFQYSGSGRQARHTSAIVWWNDMNNMGTLVPQYVEDKDGILEFGINETNVTAFACTSQGQAHRLGLWILLSERFDNDTCAWQTGQEGMVLLPGDVVAIQDPWRSGKTFSGRLESATTGQLVLDKEVEIEAGKTYQMRTLKEDGTSDIRSITNGTGDTDTLFVTPAFDTAPDAKTVWILAASDLEPELYWLLSVVPNEPAGTVSLMGLKYNDSKFATVDFGTPLEEPVTSVLPKPGACLPAGRITITDVTVNLATGVRQDLRVVWEPSPDPFIRNYKVHYRRDDGNWTPLDLGAVAEATLQGAQPGTYQFRVVAVNTLGANAAPVYENHAVGVENPLEDATITGLEILGQGINRSFSGRDVEFGWRVNSPANNAELGGSDPTGLNGRLDPFFQAYVLTMYIKTFTGTITSGSKTLVSNDANFTTEDLERGIRGIGIPVGTQVAVRNSATQIQLSKEATETRTVVFYLNGRDQDGSTKVKEPVLLESPHYTMTFELNKAAHIDAHGLVGPFPDYTIGVQLLDAFNNLSPEEKITIHKTLPTPPTEPANLLPTIGGASAQWTNANDPARDRNDIYMDAITDALNPTDPIASTSATSSQKAIDGITGTGARAFWVRAVNVFGLTSTFLFLGWVQPGSANNIAEVTFLPDGGALPGPTPPDNNILLTHPDPAAQIWYQINLASADDFAFSNVESENNHWFDEATELGINDDNASVTAAAFVHGLWGPAKRRVYTRNSGGGGDAASAPEYDPVPGTYEEPSGQLPISFGRPGASAIYYTKTINGSEPATPTHDGSGNPTGTTIKVAGASVSLTLLRGMTRIKAIAAQTGVNDSGVAEASYTVIKTIGEP